MTWDLDDIEQGVGQAAGGRAVAFAAERTSEITAVVGYEGDVASAPQTIAKIRAAVPGELDSIVLVPPGAVTSSRDALRREWHTGGLQASFVWRHSREVGSLGLDDWLRVAVADVLAVSADQVDPAAPLADLGVDSVQLIALQECLEKRIGRSVSDELFWECPSIDAVAAALLADEEPTPNPEMPAVPDRETVAVVGIGFRVGDVTGPEELWPLIVTGDPDARLAPSSAPAARRHARFDARFFGITPREAARMDPQQRAVLEVGWQAIEDAGIDPRSLAGTRTGVFVGAAACDYSIVSARSGAPTDMHAITGLSPAVIANRMSYVLDLRGPSLTVDTACSSSLVALHLACRSLRARECDLAIVAGVNLILLDEISDGLAEAGALSPTGACHSFDAAADGYARAEGCAVVTLERSRDAEEARRRIYGTVEGSAINQDGRTNGLTAPNPRAQEAVIRCALADAGRSTSDVFAIEAHATGTPLGDPIEVSALRNVFIASQSVLLTSAKSLLGHLEAAAGIAGFIRTVLCAYHGQVPAQPRFELMNPSINLGPGLEIPRSSVAWAGGVMGVSSFGFGGTNSHVIVSRCPSEADKAISDPGFLPISGHTEEALRQRVRQVELAIAESSDEVSVRSTLIKVAGNHRFRLILPTGGASAGTPTLAPRPPSLAAVFGGQGISRSPGSGPAGIPDAAVDIFLHLSEAAGPIRGRSLSEWLDEATPPTDVVQPLVVASAISLYRTLDDAGISFATHVGHSVGEISAMAAAGIFTDEDAVRFAARRGEVMATLAPPGAMLNVLADAQTTLELIADSGSEVEVAAYNSRTSTVVSGDPPGVERLQRRCDAAGITSIRLPVERAFHSAQLERCLDEIRRIADSVPVGPATRTVISTLDGQIRMPGWAPDAEYWVEQARRPVLFDLAIRTGVGAGSSTFVDHSLVPALFRLRRGSSDERWVSAADPMTLLADLYMGGHTVRWDRAFAARCPSVPVPPYPFMGGEHWVGDAAAAPITSKEVAMDDRSEALRLALAGFGVGPGSEVVLANLSDAATTVAEAAAAAVGARTRRVCGREVARGALVITGNPAGETRAGATVVVDATGRPEGRLCLSGRLETTPRLSVAFFGDQPRGTEGSCYEQLISVARLADELGFEAIWTPERHFDAFGGAFPSPAVLSAAIARETSRIGIRAGSVVLPLAHSARIVEDWALVDRLSNGRVGVAFATGWRDRDRVLAPSAAPVDVEASIDRIRRLWRGELLTLEGPDGQTEAVRVQPAPVQTDLPIWLTTVTSPETWIRAAHVSAGVLTNMMGRSTESLEEDIARYRAAGGVGGVTVFLHAHIDHDAEAARRTALEPLRHYLASSAALFSRATNLPWLSKHFDGMADAEIQDEIAAISSLSAQRYLSGSSLIGDVDSCREVLSTFAQAGVNEIGCLVDFGVPYESIVATLEQLAPLNTAVASTWAAA